MRCAISRDYRGNSFLCSIGRDCSQTKTDRRRNSMHDIIIQLGAGLQLTGEIAQDVAVFLTHHGRPDTARHCGAVAAEARRIATLVVADLDAAEVAGWLHDI